MNEQLRVPPFSLEAEQSVLGGLLLDNQAVEGVARILSESDFYRDDHRRIYHHIGKLAEKNRPADMLTVFESIEQSEDKGKTGGLAYLGALAQNTPSAHNIRRYAEIVRERSVQRQLIKLGSEIVESGFNPAGEKIEAVLDAIGQKLSGFYDTRGSGPAEITALLGAVMEEIDQKYHADADRLSGLPTGFIDLDAIIDGLEPADLVIIAGRPSMGKTAIAMNITEHVLLEDGLPVLVFSLEMSDRSLIKRMLGSVCRVDQHKLKHGRLSDDDWARLSAGIGRLHDAPLIIEETSGLTVGELRARARSACRKYGKLGLIIVDYLQLMAARGETRNLALTEISQGLKALAKELDTPVCALSQLNRGLEARNNKRPIMSDLRDSGAIEQDADKILFMYRDEEYNRESVHKGVAEVIVGKNRNGPTGTARLTWLRELTRFENFAGEVPSEAPRRKERGFKAAAAQPMLYAD